MKRHLYIFALMIATCCFAQQHMPMAVDTTCAGWIPGLPDHYCECTRTSQPFAFPLEVEVNGTPQWFSATVKDMEKGLSAYWISDEKDTITFEIYAFCSSAVPTVTMSVGPNQMREMSPDGVAEKIKQAGSAADVLKPRIRVYTEHGRSGKVYCFPYDQGPTSTCDSTLQLYSAMTYVCDRPEEVYVLKPLRMSSYGRGFFLWKQKKNKPATIRLTKDSCNGPEIDSFTLSDSLRVHILNPDTIKNLKTKGHNVYVHVSHDSSYVGRLIYRSTIGWNRQVIDTTICQGKVLQLPDTTLSESTFYGGDTLWFKKDTLSLTGYNLTVVPPTPVYDTLRLRAKQLPYSYHNNIIPKDGWGDYDFTIHQAGKCDERYMLHVEHKVDTVITIANDTICLGKTVTYSGKSYSKDTVINDSIWKNADTWEIRDITLHFTDPEIEYDTISVPPSQMPNVGYYYSALGMRVKYGDTLIVKTKRNTCTRYIQLHVGKEIKIVEADMDTTICLGKIMVINNKIYAKDTVVYDSILIDGDTWQAGNITIHYAEPEMEYDTVVLCLGKTYTIGEMSYTEDADFRDTVAMDDECLKIRNIAIRFTEPELEYDTIYVKPEQLIPAGDTLLIIAEEDECTRWIQQHIVLTEAIHNAIDPAVGTYKYLHRGVLYIRRGETDYDLYGRPLKRQ